MAVGTQLVAGFILIPLIPLWPPAEMPSPLVAGSMLCLDLVCGAIAYLLYFRLIADIGPTVPHRHLSHSGLRRAVGPLSLGETISPPMLVGAGLVLVGTVFVLQNLE